MKTALALFASSAVLLLSQGVRADRGRPDLRGGGDRFERPQWERANLRVERIEPAERPSWERMDHDSRVQGSIRPDPARDRGNPVDGSTGRLRGSSTGVRIAKTLAGLRPDPNRDRVNPVDAAKGAPRGISTGIRVVKKLSGLRPDPNRDRVNPVDETKGVPRGLATGIRVQLDPSGLRPDPSRDRAIPVDESTGAPRGIPAERLPASGRPGVMLQILRHRGDDTCSGPLCR